MKQRTLLITMIATVAGLTASTPAHAQNPAGCSANRFAVDIIADRSVFRVGDTVNYTVEIANVGSQGCNVSNIFPTFRFPAPDGTATGPAVALTPPGLPGPGSYPIGTTTKLLGPFAHVAAINPGVRGLVANVSAPDGILHDPLLTPLNINKNISVVLTAPKISIDKIGSIVAGQAPQNVVYTFNVRNDSTTAVPMDRVVVTDDRCGSPALQTKGGDGDDLLENGETWVFTCAMLHQAPGVYTNTASVCAYSTVPGDTTRPVCSPPDNWTVTLTPPPAAPPAVPQVAVKPTTAAQAPCTLSTPKSLRVRAGQLNTIRVRVRNVDAGSKVTLKLPGTKKKYTAKTNSSGTATLRVRPKKSGRAKLSVADCSEVENLQVRPARRVTAQRNPRVTG